MRDEVQSLQQILDSHSGRVIHKITHYIPIYETHFAKYRSTNVRVLEIGVGKGGSLEVWKKYFGEDSLIVGLDIREACLEYADDGIEVVIGSQSNSEVIKELLSKFGPFDIVIDDGSHKMNDIATTFRLLYPHLPQHGLYLIEDLCCSYWPEYEGGFRSPKSFIELSKSFIDFLNKEHWGEKIESVEDWLPSTNSISFYDSVIVFSRGAQHKFRSVKYPVSQLRL